MTEEDRMTWPEHPTCHSGGFPNPKGHQHWRAPREGDPFRTCGYCGSIHPGDLVAALEAGATLGGADWKYGWPHKFYVNGIPDTRAGQQISKGSRPIQDRELWDWLVDLSVEDERLIMEAQREQISLDPKLLTSERGRELAAALESIDATGSPSGVVARAAQRVVLVGASQPSDDLTLDCEPIFGEATTAFAKWYNEHLLDDGYSPEARTRLIELLHERAGILFEIDEAGMLRYSAPYRGYQRGVSDA